MFPTVSGENECIGPAQGSGWHCTVCVSWSDHFRLTRLERKLCKHRPPEEQRVHCVLHIYSLLFLEWVFLANLLCLHPFLHLLNSYWSFMTQPTWLFWGGLLRAPSGSQSSWRAIQFTQLCWPAWFMCLLRPPRWEPGGDAAIFYSSLYLWSLAGSAKAQWIFMERPFLACTLKLGFSATASDSLFYLLIHLFTHSLI